VIELTLCVMLLGRTGTRVCQLVWF